MVTCSLVSVNCSRQFSVKQLKFEIYIILCQYSITVFFRLLNGEINISDCNFLSSGGHVIVKQWLVHLYMYVEVFRELQIILLLYVCVSVV